MSKRSSRHLLDVAGEYKAIGYTNFAAGMNAAFLIGGLVVGTLEIMADELTEIRKLMEDGAKKERAE